MPPSRLIPVYVLIWKYSHRKLQGQNKFSEGMKWPGVSLDWNKRKFSNIHILRSCMFLGGGINISAL